MDFLNIVKNRYSARNYTSAPVEQEKVDYIIECARLAPSAVNFQPWHFLVVKSEENKQKLRLCYPREWFKTAPIYIVVCVDSATAWVRKSDDKNHADIDGAIAAEHICLAATAQGLGSCWVCNFDTALFAEYFPSVTEQYPVAIISLGYSKEPPVNPSPRKEIAQIVTII